MQVMGSVYIEWAYTRRPNFGCERRAKLRRAVTRETAAETANAINELAHRNRHYGRLKEAEQLMGRGQYPQFPAGAGRSEDP